MCAHFLLEKPMNYLICIEHIGWYCGIADSVKSHFSIPCSSFDVSVTCTQLHFGKSWRISGSEQRDADYTSLNIYVAP